MKIKNLKISEENHQKMDQLRAKNKDFKTFDDVLTMLLEDYVF